MKIEHLYYFLVLSSSSSISQAAQKLFISQQHLSRIVANLEKELHIQLLRRTSTGVEITEKGQIFLRFAEKIVNDYREMQSYFYMDALPPLTQEPIQGNCQIVFPFFFSLYLNDFIQKLTVDFPQVTIQCFEKNDSYSPEELQRSNMLHLITNPITEPDFPEEIAVYYLGESTASFCINRKSPLAQKPFLTQQDLNSQLQTTHSRSLTDRTLFADEHILFSSSNIYQHLDSVVRNSSICIVPTYTRKGIYAAYPDVILLPFERKLSVPIYIVHSNAHELNNAERAVMHFTAQYIQSLIQEEAPLSH